jgi:hypothetical protein
MGSRWNSSLAAVPSEATIVPRPPKMLCRRALDRLRIAANLMHLRLEPGEMTDEAAGRLILGVIERLNLVTRERLQAQVDWVEAYEAFGQTGSLTRVVG